ncbi:hypothetical protein B4U79_17963 [Dinothrombium tinctorium]|uniref:Ig-like domain-containing protein n=1 Tax=Dinothrombium tinctorium TaxID=1965070 RepID=A0A443RE57_9ACAR|nr:hypothetical protein B4U79_17963 [Dinothrombium tinctorium]
MRTKFENSSSLLFHYLEIIFASLTLLATHNRSLFVHAANAGSHRFLEQPTDAYIVHKGSTIIGCSVENSIEAWFDCNSNSPFKDRQKVYRRDQRLPTTIEVHLQINRSDVDTFADASSEDFQCWCVSKSTSNELIQSRKASIRLAYIRKKFLVDPESTSALLGSSAKFACLPDGFPAPRVLWFRKSSDNFYDRKLDCQNNDEPDLDLSAKCIVSQNGGLIINNVTYADEGRYFCKAGNIAGTHPSESAQLSVTTFSESTTPVISVNQMKTRIEQKSGSSVPFPTSFLVVPQMMQTMANFAKFGASQYQ